MKNLSKKDKILARAIKQSRRSQTYIYWYLIPRNYMEAIQFDKENKNSKWDDAIKLEMESCYLTRSSKGGIRQSYTNTRRSSMHLRDITRSRCLMSSLMVDTR